MATRFIIKDSSEGARPQIGPSNDAAKVDRREQGVHLRAAIAGFRTPRSFYSDAGEPQ
jgi:hypothetical protein